MTEAQKANVLGVSEEYWAMLSEVLRTATPTGAWALSILTMTCSLSQRPQPPRSIVEAVAGSHTLAEANAVLKTFADYADLEISIAKVWRLGDGKTALRTLVGWDAVRSSPVDN